MMNNEQFIASRLDKRCAYFRIANHFIAIQYDEIIDIRKGLASFAPFSEPECPQTGSLVAVFDISMKPAPANDPKARLLSDVSMILDERFRFEETDEHYITSIDASDSEGKPWKMVSTKEFTQSIIYADPDELYSTFKCNWLIMVAFGQAVLAHKTILLHSSVIEKEGYGYAFLGKSGTGKSTHSRLWLSHISGTALLNDDNPAVRVHDDGQVIIYGTPWSGKTHCYKQKAVRLGAIIRLEQAPFNKLSWKQGKDALIALLPSGSAIRWNPSLFSSMLEILQLIVQNVPVGYLQCLPDKDAALLSYSEASSQG
ncbi:hypothetical protein HP439_18185 [Sphingobacterium shayense]|uniref:hypothetical protein n=1 Tax=Sphingobacterium shayense TaxID=626343 RepID=UPI0015518BAA|nr:hypothetical protein [Sphingobacterium shayense]NQD72658.1 hypothetical protein [Sphingobacterium shayense]